MGKKFSFYLNLLFIGVIAIICGLTFVAPSSQGLMLGSTLFLPGLLFVPIFFVLYWLLKIDIRVFASIVFLMCLYSFYNRLFSININQTESKGASHKIKIASFNVLHFHGQQFENNASNNCFSLFNKMDVDVIGLQEANRNKKIVSYVNSNYTSEHISQSWIYSKYKIVDSQALDISYGKHTSRKSITYADVKTENGIIRMYNLHLESYRFSRKTDELQKSKVSTFRKKVGKVFKIHEREVDELIRHIKESPYPVIVTGDFNNNAYSYEYTQLIKQCNLKDTFVEAGNGFGSTFRFKYFPLRIDFILVPKTAKVYSHQVIKKKDWSDHYPVIAEISL